MEFDEITFFPIVDDLSKLLNLGQVTCGDCGTGCGGGGSGACGECNTSGCGGNVEM